MMIPDDPAAKRWRPRRWHAAVYWPWLVFWIVQLAGLRHAHRWMFVPATMMAVYLAVYPLAFTIVIRRLPRTLPLSWTAPLVWVATEWVRNHLGTGISIGMLGHGMANSSHLAAPASWGGSYAVSAWAMLAGATALAAVRIRWREALVGVTALGLALGFSNSGAPTKVFRNAGPTIALVQRNESVDYADPPQRQLEIFDAYAEQTVRSLSETQTAVDVVVWPESMMTGGAPWMEIESDLVVPPDYGVPEAEFRAAIADQQRYFRQRVDALQRRLAAVNHGRRPIVIGGCAVVRYGDHPRTYSGVVSVDADAQRVRWYGKRHLVMFGEYIPLISHVPGLRNLVPPGLGMTAGERVEVFDVGKHFLMPTVCIETAVEHLIPSMVDAASSPVDAVLTVTNDGWFDGTRVVRLHRRAAQMVAVRAGRPIFSAANGGPTMVIDRWGQIVESLPLDAAGVLISGL